MTVKELIDMLKTEPQDATVTVDINSEDDDFNRKLEALGEVSWDVGFVHYYEGIHDVTIWGVEIARGDND